jgi:hypothetical protein
VDAADEGKHLRGLPHGYAFLLEHVFVDVPDLLQISYGTSRIQLRKPQTRAITANG